MKSLGNIIWLVFGGAHAVACFSMVARRSAQRIVGLSAFLRVCGRYALRVANRVYCALSALRTLTPRAGAGT